MNVVETIENVIKEQLRQGNQKFIIYPYGIAGYAVRRVLQERFSIEPVCVIDNYRYGAYDFIEKTEYLMDLDKEDITVLLATKNPKVLAEIREILNPFSGELHIVDVFPMKVGKHTMGDSILAHHTGYVIEKIGAYCSFADGCSVVGNHDLSGVSTFALFQGLDLEGIPVFRNVVNNVPISRLINCERSVIGNDVWFGRNVTICNGAKIGDGVIAAAGAVITKDIPNYAVVGGVPAKVLKYRYNKKQIEMLNEIKWWEWPDEKVAENFHDFADIERFLEKHSKMGGVR